MWMCLLAMVVFESWGGERFGVDFKSVGAWKQLVERKKDR